jgi:hypothetical protein
MIELICMIAVVKKFVALNVGFGCTEDLVVYFCMFKSGRRPIRREDYFYVSRISNDYVRRSSRSDDE